MFASSISYLAKTSRYRDKVPAARGRAARGGGLLCRLRPRLCSPTLAPRFLGADDRTHTDTDSHTAHGLSLKRPVYPELIVVCRLGHKAHVSECRACFCPRAGTGATGCRSCVLFGAKTRRFEPGRAGDVNTLNTNRPTDAESASLGGGVALTGFSVLRTD